MAAASKDTVLVAAIDFGTTFSGYSFSFQSAKDDIKMNKSWGAVLGFESYKAPTCVCIDSTGKFVAFGYEAQNKFSGDDDDDDDDSESSDDERPKAKGRPLNLHIYDRFKMLLHRDEDLSETVTLFSSDGHMFPALRIFTMALRYLKNHLMDAITKFLAGKPDEQRIRWVLTVPAIWSDSAKQFMRLAAKNAGIIDHVDAKQLVIALEPEAASLFCRDLDLQNFHGLTEKLGSEKLNLAPGTKYMVVDSGGGTVDITAHQVQRGGKICELHVATGGAWGGTKVDDNFIACLKTLLGKDFINILMKEDPQCWLALLIEFEKKKRQIEFDNASYKLTIQTPWNLGTKYKQVKEKDIRIGIKEANHRGITFSNGMIVFPFDVIKEMFDPVLKMITDHLDGLLNLPSLKGLSYIFLVGGFSDCALLEHSIRDKFGEGREVLVPGEAANAVVKGAVKFGWNPETISSRKARKTYGTDVVEKYSSRKHHPEHKIRMPEGSYCRDIFHKFVTKYEEIDLDDVREYTLRSVKPNQKRLSCSIYSIDSETVSYITDEGVSRTPAEIAVDLSASSSAGQERVKVFVTFGSTEVFVEAVNEKTGKREKVAINFLRH